MKSERPRDLEFRLGPIMEARNLSVADLEKATGIPKTTIYSLLSGQTALPNPRALVKFCRTLDLQPGDLIVLRGLDTITQK